MKTYIPISVIVICIFESFTKGWLSFMMVPALVIVIPAYLSVVLIARHDKYLSIKPIRIASIALTVSLLGLYVLMPGVGDTNDVLLFGVYESNTNTLVAQTAQIFAFLFTITLIPAFIWLIYLLITNRKIDKERSQSNNI
jgi:hypothetical protein